jgi:hypothetical protein
VALSIAVGFGTVIYQNRRSDKLQRAERHTRAEVVAFRLSGWLRQVGSEVEAKLSHCQQARGEIVDGMNSLVPTVQQETHLNISDAPENALSHLHHLSSGAKDIAQLAYLVSFFNYWVEETLRSISWVPFLKPAPMMTDSTRRINSAQLRVFYDDVEVRVRRMKELQMSAARHLQPLLASDEEQPAVWP